MTILELTIRGFGKFHDKNFKFGDGMNVFYGKNEAGKSTIHTFIRSMLFGMEKKTSRVFRDNYARFEPWDDQGTYEGELRVKFDNKTYKVQRIFQRDQQKLQIINETDGLPIENPELFLSKMLFGMTETSYTNTISIGQLKSATEAGMATELRRYITNLNTSGNISINIPSTIEYLKGQKIKYEEMLVPDAVVKYSTMLGEIKNIEKSIANPEFENHFPEITSQKEANAIKLIEANEKVEKLSQKITSLSNILKTNGFDSKKDISYLRDSTEKIFRQYQKLIKKEEGLTSNILGPLGIVLGIFLIVVHTFLIFAMFPQIFKEGRLYDYFLTLNPKVSSLFAPIFANPIWIILVYVFAFACLIYGIIALIKHFERKDLLEDISYTLSEIFNHQLGESEINQEVIEEFEKHINAMEKLFQEKDELYSEINSIELDKNQLLENEKNYTEGLQKLQAVQYELDNKLKRISDLKDACDSLRNDIQHNDEINKEIDAINLSIETMSELSTKIKSSFGTILNKAASEYLEGITKGKYDSISIDDALGVYLNTKERAVPMDQVSSGTMDQIYLALRLASASLIMGNSEEKLPLLFDDSFVMYDDDRLAAALTWLSENIKAQIIIFTCHKREMETLDALHIDYKAIWFD